MKKIIVIGAGGHSRSVCDILLQDSNNQIVGLIDRSDAKGFWDLKVLGGDDILPDIIKSGVASYAFVALGDNLKRRLLFEKIRELGYLTINAVSQYAYVSSHARLGRGIALMPGAIIGPNAVVGNGTIINTNASIDHDDQIGAFCHIAPGSTLCGVVTVEDEVFVGAGARIIDFISVGSRSIIGAGASVITDIPAHCTAVGVPAKVIKLH